MFPNVSHFLIYKRHLRFTRALDVHKVGVGRLYESLELVGALLVLDGGVKKIDGQLYRNA